MTRATAARSVIQPKKCQKTEVSETGKRAVPKPHNCLRGAKIPETL